MGLLDNFLGSGDAKSGSSAPWWQSMNDARKDNRNALMMAGIGLMSAPDAQQGFANMAKGIVAGRHMDEAVRQRQAKTQKRNQTMEYLQQHNPEIAGMVQGGMPIAEAWKQVMEQRKGHKPTDLMQNTQAAGFKPGTEAYQQAIQGKLFAPQKTTAQRDYEYAQQNPEFSQHQIDMKRAGSTNVNVNQGGSAFEKELAKGTAKMFVTLGEGFNQARVRGGQLDRLEGILSRVETGGRAKMQQMAGEFGINTEGLDEIQSAMALINRMVPEQRAPGSGQMSNKDVELFKQSLPRLINQPQGNQLIINTLRGLNEYQLQQGRIGQLVQMGKMSREEGMRALQELPDPMAEFTNAMKNSGGVDRGAELRSKYGLE